MTVGRETNERQAYDGSSERVQKSLSTDRALWATFRATEIMGGDVDPEYS
jgi:hypothetical protein